MTVSLLDPQNYRNQNLSQSVNFHKDPTTGHLFHHAFTQYLERVNTELAAEMNNIFAKAVFVEALPIEKHTFKCVDKLILKVLRLVEQKKSPWAGEEKDLCHPI